MKRNGMLEEIKARRNRENRGLNEFAVLYRTTRKAALEEDFPKTRNPVLTVSSGPLVLRGARSGI